MCDRLLLLGLLGEKLTFSADDVQEVVNEMMEESSYGGQPQADRNGPAVSVQLPTLELDLARLLVTPGLAEEIANQIDTLGVEQYDERLRRMERSVLRLERLNLEILVMLQKLVATAATPDLAPQP